MGPKKLIAGDTVSWTHDKFLDADGVEVTSSIWDLTYYFRKVGAALASLIEVEGDANSDSGWDFEKLFASDLSPGTYNFAVKAIKIADPTVIVTVASGQVQATGSISSATSFEGRSQARQDLEAVQAAMRSIISGGAVQEYTIGNRSVRKMTMEDLIKLESKLKADVVREEKAERLNQGLGDPNNLFVRFRRPT